MNINLEPVPWGGGEAYKVSVTVNGGGSDVGHVWRFGTDAKRWSFAATEVFDDKHPTAVQFEADGLEAVRAELGQRFRVTEVPSDRLTHEAMHGMVAEMLMVLHKLAVRSNSREGFISGTASAVAYAIAASMKPEGDERFIEIYTTELRANVTRARQIAGVAGEFTKVIGAMMGALRDGNDNGGGNTTH